MKRTTSVFVTVLGVWTLANAQSLDEVDQHLIRSRLQLAITGSGFLGVISRLLLALRMFLDGFPNFLGETFVLGRHTRPDRPDAACAIRGP